MPEPELRQISNWAKKVPNNGVIVEIGSFLGRSSVCWAMSAHNSVKIYCIDRFGVHYINSTGETFDSDTVFKQNTESFPNVVMIKGSSPHDIDYPGDKIDVVFLDAAHKNPDDWNNIEFFLPHIKNGGMLCGHDYCDDAFPDVIENVIRLEKQLGIPVTLYEGTTLWSFNINREI